ncbi:hypothetical protein CLOM_g16816 [Closterium sp. NIES-68]|nr:hypothetical protein CLOM_g16816 [Closterium sp. NIES-68]GJP75612.1 hypothetical protein CLOP_g6041 [Closterium sp. NIES-67]
MPKLLPEPKRQAARTPRPRPALSDVTNDTSAKLTTSSKPTPPALPATKPAPAPGDPHTPAPAASKGSRLGESGRRIESGDGAHDDGADALRSEVSKLLLSTPCQEETPEIVAKSRSKLTRQSSTPNGVSPGSQSTLTRQPTIARSFSIHSPVSAIYGDVLGDDDAGREGVAHLDLCDARTPEAEAPLRRRRAAVLASLTPKSAVKTPTPALTSSPCLYAAPTPFNSPEEAPALIRCATSPIPRAKSPIPRSTASIDGVAERAQGGTGRRNRAKWQVGGKIGAMLGKDPAGLLAAIAAIREHRGSQQSDSDASADATATTICRLRSSFASPLSSPALPAGVTNSSRRVPISASVGARGPRIQRPRSPSPLRRARSPRALTSPAPERSLLVSRYQEEIPAVDLGAPCYPAGNGGGSGKSSNSGTAAVTASSAGSAGNSRAGSTGTPLRTPASQRRSCKSGVDSSPPWSTQVNVGTPGSTRRGGWALRMGRAEEGEEDEMEAVKGMGQRERPLNKGLLDALERMGLEEERGEEQD